MNRIYRVISTALCAAPALIAFDAAAAEPAPHALPTGGTVVRGAATLSESAGRLDIAQSTNRAVIDWQRFDIGRDATVNFAQPSSSSLTLNRVLSADPSAIFGRLTANGQVFLTSPNGVLFGSSARVDVGGLVATSMQIGLEDFLSGNYRFSGGAGTVANYGTIDVAAGGYLALMAPEVRNEGVLSAHLGTIALAAGQAATLQLDPGAPFAVQVDPATVDVLLENRHLIHAEGGQVILSASAAERLMEAAIPGTSGATGLVAANGTTRLVNVEGEIRASQIAIDGGAVGVTRVAGSLDATAGDMGGSVLVTGDKVLIDAGAALDASGRDGGSVLIGGDRQGANPDVRNAARVFVDAAADVRADGGADATQDGDAGRVIVYSRENSQVHGTLSARGGASGGNGGFIETSGGALDVTRVPDASAAVGTGGEWLIDPYNITIQAAGSDTSIGSSPNWSSTADSAILTTASLQSALNAGTSVTITTGSAGSQGGDIVVSSAITKSAGGSATLTMTAHRDIVIGAAITATTGALSLSLDADSNNDLAGAIVLSGNLTTLGGAINFLDGLVIGGSSALSINTAGGAGGNINFNGQVLIGNTNGVTITTGGGNVTFASLLDSGNDYTYVNNPLTWLNARTAAASGTGAFVGNTYLATITSPLEMSRAAATANYSQSWLGGSDASAEGTWRWVAGPEGLEDGGQGRIFLVGNRSGQPALTGYNGYNGGYVNWNAGEPNDVGGEDALQLGFGAAGQWNDLPTNSSTLPYVMETNLASSPLTIDSGSGSVTFNGDIGANKAIGALTLSGSGNVNLNANTLNVSGNLTMNAGGDLVIGASNSPTLFADDGTIHMHRDIVKSAGANAALVLRADNDIRIDSGADIISSSNRLDITLNSDRDASGDGSIVLASGAVLTSNGGNVTLRGGSAALGAVADPTSAAASFISTLNATGARGSSSAGVSLQGASIVAGGGNIDIRGVGSDGLDGISIGASSSIATTGSGSIAIHGLGGANSDDSDGIAQNNSSSSTESGELRMQGLGRGGSESQGIDLGTLGATPTVSATDGNVVLRGVSTGNGNVDQGILVRNSAYVRTTGAGSIDAVGRGGGLGGGRGIHVTTGAEIEVAGGGDISLTGYGSSTGTQGNNEGVTVDAGLVEVLSATDSDLSVIGYGGTGTNYNIGVNIRVGGTLRSYATAGGSITVNGTGGNGSGTGNWGTLAEDGIYESMGAAPMLLTGIGGTGTDNYGIRSTGGSSNRIGSATMTGALTLRADTMDLATAAVIVRGAGTLALEPYSSGTTIGIGNGATGTLNLNTTALGRLVDGFSQITIGRSDGTGAIDVEVATFSDNLRLLNASGGIDFDGAVSVGANRLWLTSAAAVTQSAAISANQLLLTGAGPVTLTHASNSIGTLAASLSGNVSLTNNGSLSVGSITANGITYDGVASTGGSVLLRAAGASADLTLQRAVTTTTAGTSLQLVAGRNFVNNFGVSALDAGVGRWLVWSSDPTNDVRGGLAYDFKQYAATYGVTSPVQSSGDGFMYSIAPTLTPTLTGSVARTYDATTTVTLSNANFSNTGSIDGDAVTLTTSNPGVLDNKNVGTGKQVTADSISIAGATNGAAAVYGYQLAATGATGAIGEVTPRTVTASLTGSITKVYDGNTAATLASGNYSLAGVLGADVVSLNDPTAGTYASANVGNAQLVTVTGLALAGAEAGNYALAASSASASIGDITPKSLLVTAADASRIYGDANPQFTIDVSGFVAGEDESVLGGSLSFSTPAGPTSDVGTYAINASGLNASNYLVSYAPGTLTIDPAALAIAASAASKIYGDTDPVLGYTVGGAGLRNGDVLTGSLSAPTGAAATAGTHQILQGTLAATSNYTVSFTPGTLTVTQSPLTITALDQAKVYGDAEPSLTYAIGGAGLRYNDELDGALVAPTGAAATAGSHQIGQGTLSAGGNYAVTFNAGTLSVSQAQLLIEADDQIKVYGDAEPLLTYRIGGSGLRYADTLSGSLLAPIGAAANAGSHVIGQGTLAASSNYEMTFVPATLSVSRAPLVITPDDQARFVFNTNPELSASGTGWRYGDGMSVVTGLQLSTVAAADSVPGSYPIDASGASAANYSITYQPGALQVLPQSVLTELPQGGEVVSHAGAQAAPPTAPDVVALSNSAPAILSAIHNGGVATASGSAGVAAPTSTSAGFIAAEPLRAVDIGSSQQVEFSLPAGTFRHADSQAAITTTAMCADGSPLPASLSYDPQTGTLTGSLPEGMTELAVVFIARDGMGGEATTTLVLHAEE